MKNGLTIFLFLSLSSLVLLIFGNREEATFSSQHGFFVTRLNQEKVPHFVLENVKAMRNQTFGYKQIPV